MTNSVKFGKHTISRSLPPHNANVDEKIEHVAASKNALKQLDIDHTPEDGVYGSQHHITVSDGKTDSAFNVYQSGFDSNKNKPILSVRGYANHSGSAEHKKVLNNFLSRTAMAESFTLETIKQRLMENLQSKSLFMPEVPFKKSANSEGLHHDHDSKYNGEVHNHLKSLGFKQQGASDTYGPKTVTTYKNDTTGITAEHHKGTKSSKLIVSALDDSNL
jgi:hypothetical protein